MAVENPYWGRNSVRWQWHKELGGGGDVKIWTEKRYFLGCSTRFEAEADLELQLCEGSGPRDQLPNPEPLHTKPSFSNPRNQGA